MYADKLILECCLFNLIVALLSDTKDDLQILQL